MIRWINALLFILAVSFTGRSQDVFNLENSRRFAQYLFDSGQYDLAADEFERVVFMAPKDSISILNLLKSYRLEQDYDVGLTRSMELLPETEKLSKEFLQEMYYLRALTGNHKDNLAMVRENQRIDESQRKYLELSALMLDRQWDAAQTFYQSQNSNHPSWNANGSLLDKRNTLGHKSPFLAASLSLVVPGLGKVYTTDWQDGLVALLFVATNGWQAYRGFSQDGIKSAYGWIFGSIGAGFWLGNVYGSYKSAKKYNERITNGYYEKVEQTVFSRF